MTFQDLDVEVYKEKLALETKGKRRGERNMPGSDTNQPDEVEQEIIELIQTEQKKVSEQFLGNMRAFSSRLSHLNPEVSVAEIKNEASKAVTDFSVGANSGIERLHTLEAELKQARNDLSDFQTEHNRKHAASIKSALWIAVSIGIVLILFGFETFFNGTMLGQGLLGGTRTGLTYAMGFSLFNIILGAMTGIFGFRKTFHVKLTQRIAGWLIILGCLLLALIFNLLVGHFRDALSGENWEEAPTLALDAMWASPFMLQTFESNMLLAIGVLMWMVTALDFFYMDDPYPGYGKVTRAYRKARDRFQHAKEGIGAELERSRDNGVAKMELSQKQAGNWRAEYSAILAHRDSLQQAFLLHARQLETAGNRLLGYYRAANVQARTTAQPQSFKVMLDLEKKIPPTLTAGPILTDERVAQLASQATSELQAAVARLNEEYPRQLDRLKKISDVLG